MCFAFRFKTYRGEKKRNKKLVPQGRNEILLEERKKGEITAQSALGGCFRRKSWGGVSPSPTWKEQLPCRRSTKILDNARRERKEESITLSEQSLEWCL